jgi:hypothetical protein
MNHLMSRQVIGEPTPTVGMGATLLMWTDRHACTIQRIFEDKRLGTVLEVTEDKATLVGGSTMSEDQDYTFESRPDGPKRYFAKKNGLWREYHYRIIEYRYDEEKDERCDKRSKRLSESPTQTGLKIGVRDEYRDPTF